MLPSGFLPPRPSWPPCPWLPRRKPGRGNCAVSSAGCRCSRSPRAGNLCSTCIGFTLPNRAWAKNWFCPNRMRIASPCASTRPPSSYRWKSAKAHPGWSKFPSGSSSVPAPRAPIWAARTPRNRSRRVILRSSPLWRACFWSACSRRMVTPLPTVPIDRTSKKSTWRGSLTAGIPSRTRCSVPARETTGCSFLCLPARIHTSW